MITGKKERERKRERGGGGGEKEKGRERKRVNQTGMLVDADCKKKGKQRPVQ